MLQYKIFNIKPNTKPIKININKYKHETKIP